MTREARNRNIEELIGSLQREGIEIEFKKAKDTLPNSIWETVSAFANTRGGVIILGVEERDHSFSLTGVSNAAKMESDFWSTLRNPRKISSFSIGTKAFEILSASDNREIIRITIPQASPTELPVYLNGDIRQVYIRRGEGDFLVTEDELKALIRNGSPKSHDRLPMKELSLEALDRNALVAFKSIIEARYPEASYEEMKMQDFLLHLGLLDDSDKENICPYAGTLLLFGRYNVIKRYYDSYQIDYFDYRGSADRWSDRIATDDLGAGEMNIFNFYNIVYQKLISTSKTGFRLDENMVRVNTDMKAALREALVNTIVHADYSMPNTGLKIEVFDTYYRFENPGKMLIDAETFFRGGSTRPRNDLIMSVFRRMGLSERQGYGGYLIFKSATSSLLRAPQIETSLEKTILTIYLVDLPGSYPDLTDTERDILSVLLHTGNLSKSDIESVIGNRYSEYRIKVALKALREKGILQTTGNGRSVRYSVNMSNAEGLGQIRLMMERLSELIRKQ